MSSGSPPICTELTCRRAADPSICAEADGELYVLLPRIAFDAGDPEDRPDAIEVYHRAGRGPFPLSSYEFVIDERIKRSLPPSSTGCIPPCVPQPRASRSG